MHVRIAVPCYVADGRRLELRFNTIPTEPGLRISRSEMRRDDCYLGKIFNRMEENNYWYRLMGGVRDRAWFPNFVDSWNLLSKPLPNIPDDLTTAITDSCKRTVRFEMAFPFYDHARIWSYEIMNAVYRFRSQQCSLRLADIIPGNGSDRKKVFMNICNWTGSHDAFIVNCFEPIPPHSSRRVIACNRNIHTI